MTEYDVWVLDLDWRFLGVYDWDLYTARKYAVAGYHVERCARDRRGALPLFPGLAPANESPTEWLDTN